MQLLWTILITVNICCIRAQDRKVYVPGDRATITCSQEQVQPGVQWLLNGTSLEASRNYSNLSVVFSETLNQGVLIFTYLTVEYNKTEITCRANTTSRMEVSTTVLLLIQGLLPAVKFLMLIEQNSSITLSWEAPFTLDIPRVDPDITGYCVNVISSISLQQLDSVCGITETEFTYPKPACDGYTLTVIPVNIVGNGTASSPVRFFPQQQLPGIIQDVVRNFIDEVPHYTLRMSAPVCSIDLILTDDDTEEVFRIQDMYLSILKTNITFSAQQLTENRHYNVSATAFNVFGRTTTSQTSISTHDIQWINEDLAAVYSEHSSAAGALYTILHINDEGAIDFTKSSYLAVNRSALISYASPYSGQYRVLVYDIEEDETLQNGVGYPAATAEVSIEQSTAKDTMPPEVNNCEVNLSRNIISAVCSSSVLAFQMIVQSSNPESVHKLYVNQNSDNKTTTSVSVEETGKFHVTIFAIREESGILDSHIEYSGEVKHLNDSKDYSDMKNNKKIIYISIGTGLGILSLVTITLLSLGAIACFKKAKRSKFKIKGDVPKKPLPNETKSSETGVAFALTPPSQAPEYEEVTLPFHVKIMDKDDGTLKRDNRSFQISQCPAYGVTSFGHSCSSLITH